MSAVMSYTYLLVKMAPHAIGQGCPNLKDVTEENVINFGYATEEVKEQLTRLYPNTVWDSQDVLNRLYGKSSDVITGEIFDLPGRFSFVIKLHPPALGIHGSHHVNQTQEVISIAQTLKLSAFDAQTGKCIYLQPH
jgi:hypothetical protein